jgi:TPR repeat protein
MICACFARSQSVAPVTDCDRYVGADLFPPQSGVTFEKVDPQTAIRACEQAVNSDPSSARLVFELGRSYLRNNNFAASLRQFRKAAEQGFPQALNAMGRMYLNGFGVTKDEAEAVNWFRKAAERGDIDGQGNLGFCYQHGWGVPVNFQAAFDWYRKAAEQKSPPAMREIGGMYLTGSGVAKDEAEALNWYRRAAERGDIIAQDNLGFSYEHGRGVPVNFLIALDWYRKAADQGDALAQFNIGSLYAGGSGVTQNYVEAADWFRKAAEQSHAEAQYNLGNMYESGLGVPKDQDKAISWYKKAADQGLEIAKTRLIALGKTESTDPLSSRAMTRLKTQAAESCRSATEMGIEDCYIESLKYFRGHPRDLISTDVRDAAAYCAHVAESNDSQFCTELNANYGAAVNQESLEVYAIHAREKQRLDAEEAKQPKIVQVFAQKGTVVVAGAIVCADSDTVGLMYDLYSAHWQGTQMDRMTNGQSRLLHGAPAPLPDPKFFGCTLLPPGTPMMLERKNIVPVVTATLADGTTIRGVTWPSMIGSR